jgi:hypothetical protein
MWEEPDAHDEGRRPRGGCEQPRHHRAPGWSQQAAAIRTLGATCAYNSATSLPAAGCRGQKGGRLLLVAGGQKEGGCCWLQGAKGRAAAAGCRGPKGGRLLLVAGGQKDGKEDGCCWSAGGRRRQEKGQGTPQLQPQR